MQTSAPTIINLIQGIIVFINNILVPFVFALAFIVFIFGIAQAFIIGRGDPKKLEQGKQLALWGIIGFAIMFSVWGLVNLVDNSFGFNSQTRPDIPTFGDPNASDSNSSSQLTPLPEPLQSQQPVDAASKPVTNVPDLQPTPQPTGLK